MTREIREYPDGSRFVTDGHLGGYIEGGDPNTTYPALWAWMVKELHVRSVLDVGCGDGRALDEFEKLGCDVDGIDGIEQLNDRRVIHHDYTRGVSDWVGDVDLVWSAEFVEHVDEQYMDRFLADFVYGRYVAMTHAVPGQAGWHHVNCRSSDYWIGALAAVGFRLDENLTTRGRRIAMTEPIDPAFNYFGRTGLIFTRP